MRTKLIFLTILLLLITGCGAKELHVNNETTDQDIINYISNYIYESIGEKAEVTISNKEELVICTAWFDECLHKQTVEGAYSYNIEIRYSSNTDIIVKGIYKNAYIIDGKNIEEYIKIPNIENKIIDKYSKELENIILENFTKEKYHFYENYNNYKVFDIFTLSNNYDTLSKTIKRLNELTNKYADKVYVEYNLFILEDENTFNNLIFDVYDIYSNVDKSQIIDNKFIDEITKKKSIQIKKEDNFREDLLKDSDKLLWYHFESNIKFSNGITEVYEIK